MFYIIFEILPVI